MRTFKTPQPITVTLDLHIADIRLVASDRRDTVVEIKPKDPGKPADQKAAELTRAECSEGRLVIKSRKPFSFLSGDRDQAIEVSVALPRNSRVQAMAGMANLRGEGGFGECEIRCGSGDITMDRVSGSAQITSGFGVVRIQEMDGAATIRSASGDVHVGAVSGDLRISSANGAVSIGRTQAVTTVRTANGDISVDEIVRGSVTLETANGELRIGIRQGTAAWLDVRTRYGNVRNLLTEERAFKTDETAEVRARTSNGDVIVRRPTGA